MNVEVVAVGTELLLGQIVNSNAATIGARLAESGLDSFRQTVVGDNLERITAVLAEAMARADAVIVTGGIGPTQDDITREALCAATGLEMDFSEEWADRLRRWWERRGREMPDNNLRQAHHPRGARLIVNPKGSAPGLDLTHEGVRVFVLPGVPQEMLHMLDTHVLVELRRAAGEDSALVSRLLRTWGSSESMLAERLDDLYAAQSNPTLAFLASGGEIKLRLSAKAVDAATAAALIAPLESEIRRRLGTAVFAVDDETIEEVLVRLLGERGWTLGTAESATAGMVAARLTRVAGSSAVFRGAVVAYSADLKRSLLGVPDEVADTGVVSEPTALAMAAGAAKQLRVDVAVAVTGVAGPDPHEQPPGTMVFAVQTPEDARARTLFHPGDRERVRTYATMTALQLVRLALVGEWW